MLCQKALKYNFVGKKARLIIEFYKYRMWRYRGAVFVTAIATMTATGIVKNVKTTDASSITQTKNAKINHSANLQVQTLVPLAEL